MCNVCNDPECHYGEYCYPDGKSVRPRNLTRGEQQAVQDARQSVKIVAKGRAKSEGAAAPWKKVRERH